MDEQDDVKIEADPSSAAGEDQGEERAEQKIAKMREELSACRREKQEYMDGWQRSKADYVNALKRFEGENKAAEQKGKIRAIELLLPAYDALERAKEHGEVPTGFAAIVKQLETAFASLGLIEVGKAGEVFDPSLHEAFGQDPVESEDQDDVITAVLEKGWKAGDIVIRAAKVRVGHFTGTQNKD